MKTKTYFYRKLSKLRVITQAISFLFIVLIPILVLLGYREIIGNYYSFSIFGFEIADPSVSFQTMLLAKDIFIPLVIAISLPVIIALIFGRVFCSWVCPYTAMLDFLEFLRSKILKSKKLQGENPKPNIYWAVLIIIISLILLFSFPLVTFISAPGIISTNINYIIIGLGVSIEFLVLMGILIVEVLLSKRIWCKYVCPVGSILALFRIPKTMKISYNEDICDCLGEISPCKISCPLKLDPKKANLYPYCYNCGKCIKMCEKTGNGAIKFTFSK